MVKNEYRFITETGDRNWIDFSVNVNPLGIPATVKQNLSNIADIAGVYPDPDCKYLTSCLAKKYQISETCILCGNGADDLLYRLIFAVKPKRAIIIEPTFEEYNRALNLVGCEICHYVTKPENGFRLDEEILNSIQNDCDMLFLCNPNNPTGQIVEHTLLEKIVEKCNEKQVLFVVDECFMEFIPAWKTFTCKYLAAQNTNMIVIDAFTKTFSLAGFRLGFCVSKNEHLLSRMRLHGQAFSVSTPAQLAGICALMDTSYLKNTYCFLEEERKWLLFELKKLPLKIYSAYGNYFLLKTECKDIKEKLLARGIKVRGCSHFHGLSSAYFRIAIRPHKENEMLINELQTLLV